MSSIKKLKSYISELHATVDTVSTFFGSGKSDITWNFGCLGALIDDWENRLPAKVGDLVELIRDVSCEISDTTSGWYSFRRTFTIGARARVVDIELQPNEGESSIFNGKVRYLLKFEQEIYWSDYLKLWVTLNDNNNDSNGRERHCFTFNVSDVKRVDE